VPKNQLNNLPAQAGPQPLPGSQRTGPRPGGGNGPAATPPTPAPVPRPSARSSARPRPGFPGTALPPWCARTPPLPPKGNHPTSAGPAITASLEENGQIPAAQAQPEATPLSPKGNHPRSADHANSADSAAFQRTAGERKVCRNRTYRADSAAHPRFIFRAFFEQPSRR